jgi:hypothetical protein
VGEVTGGDGPELLFHLVRRAYGFHSADAALALLMLAAGHQPQTPPRTPGRPGRRMTHIPVRRAGLRIGMPDEFGDVLVGVEVTEGLLLAAQAACT